MCFLISLSEVRLIIIMQEHRVIFNRLCGSFTHAVFEVSFLKLVLCVACLMSTSKPFQHLIEVSLFLLSKAYLFIF